MLDKCYIGSILAVNDRNIVLVDVTPYLALLMILLRWKRTSDHLEDG